MFTLGFEQVKQENYAYPRRRVDEANLIAGGGSHTLVAKGGPRVRDHTCVRYPRKPTFNNACPVVNFKHLALLRATCVFPLILLSLDATT